MSGRARGLGARWGALCCALWLAGCAGRAQGSAGASTTPTAVGAGASASAASDAGAGAASDAGDAAVLLRPTASSAELSRLLTEGTQAYSRGDFPAAARAFQQVYAQQPTPEVAFNLARVYERMGEATEALRYYDLVLRAPTMAEVRPDVERRMVALRAYEQRRRDGIAQPPASAAELNEEGMTFFRRGLVLFQRRDYRGALLAFEQAAQYLQDRSPELFFNLGRVHEQLGHTDQAIEFLREYVRARRGSGDEAEIGEIERHIEQLEQRR